MNKNINLCEILKNCPRGTKFFSYIHGTVEFSHIEPSAIYPIVVTVKLKGGEIETQAFSKNGIYDKSYHGICVLVPSLEQPDWSKWEDFKISKFDFKILKPFDKVLVRDENENIWRCNFFSHFRKNSAYQFFCVDTAYKQCIPYNDETKYLIGTNITPPEFYNKCWEIMK